MPITSPITETVVLGIVIAITLMVLGVVALIRLIRSQSGFYFDFKGFGATLRMGRRTTDDHRTKSFGSREGDVEEKGKDV